LQLPPSLNKKIISLFEKIDTDGSKTIDKSETLAFWSKNFPKLNSNELFDQVDKNNDGSIQLAEWVEFWTLVLNSGHSAEELESEVDSI
jgi:Ca2+-binding EF-hand superfamily protein